MAYRKNPELDLNAAQNTRGSRARIRAYRAPAFIACTVEMHGKCSRKFDYKGEHYQCVCDCHRSAV